MLWIGGEESPWKGERLDWWLGLRPDLRRQRLPNAGRYSMKNQNRPGIVIGPLSRN